jgi:hypothetical protein
MFYIETLINMAAELLFEAKLEHHARMLMLFVEGLGPARYHCLTSIRAHTYPSSCLFLETTDSHDC